MLTVRYWRYSEHSHVHHVTPSSVVSIWSVWVLVVVRSFDGKLWIIWTMREELDFTLHRCKVLTVHLICEVPEHTLPNKVGLTILQTEQILIVSALRYCQPIEAGYVAPEANHKHTTNEWPALEPSLRVNVIKSPIGVSFEWPGNWETMRRVLLGEYTKGIDNVRHFSWHLGQDKLLGVPEFGVEDTLLEACELVVVFT